jgi:sporulation protein YlmC with PRC-barrel domain
MTEMLQLDLLVGRGVYDRTGRKIAAVSEVRLRREHDTYVAEGLLIGVVGWIERVGFGGAARQLGGLFGFASWRPEVRFVHWAQIDRIEPHKVRLHVRLDDIELIDTGK